MSFFGLIGLLVAFAAVIISVICLIAAQVLRSQRSRSNKTLERAEAIAWGGRVATIVSFIALTYCCLLLVYAFFSGDNTIEYVVRNRSDASGELAWLFKLSGLWAGRQGSLVFWAWLISFFNAIVVWRTGKNSRALDDTAVLVSQAVLACFTGVLLFSEDNMPFIATAPQYFTSDGQLQGAALLWGMNALLEHWAMAIHPPTLFIGYAGLTIPFAYAISALIVNDDSPKWVNASTSYLMFSWLMLGIGIGLGAIWAYVVLGWGGYWGWDPVENASLLPWLVGVALIHSFTVYRRRGAFKRWSVMCACIAFCFVVLGTFITRSGLVESVHAFEGDPVSLVLFLFLIVASLLAGAIGLIARRKSFGAVRKSDEDIESMASKEAMYYINNLIMVVFAVLLAYMTLSSALPSWLPFGGQSLTAGTYNAIARPLGIIYCAIIAICPLFAWGRTKGRVFWKQAWLPGICALVLYVLLMVYYFTYLLPSYDAMIAKGGQIAQGLLEQGHPWYYNGIAVCGFLVASFLFFNAGFMAVRQLRSGVTRRGLSTFGGSVSHFAMGIILIGLITSSMYVTEHTDYVVYDEETDTASSTFKIQDFELVYTGNDIEVMDNGDDIMYTVHFDVYRDGQFIESVSPSVQLIQSTYQQKLLAATISFPEEDLFVVYRGVNEEGDFALDVRVNPLINLVWIGFIVLMIGSFLGMIAKRRRGSNDKILEGTTVDENGRALVMKATDNDNDDGIGDEADSESERSDSESAVEKDQVTSTNE